MTSALMRLLKKYCPFHSPFTPLSLLLASLLPVSCIPTTPSQYIQPDDMADLLVDFHLVRALAHNSNLPYDSIPFYQALYMQDIFRKHGVTQEQFDSSMVYYYTRADRFEPICKRVASRLEERALILGATESEIGKYSSLNADGDTANIWPGRTRMVMTPTPPYNRWDFRLETDSTWRRGDSFLMQFVSDYQYQEGPKEGCLYLACTYTADDGRDTTVARHLRFLGSNVSQLTIPAYDDGDMKEVRGYFYLGDGNDHNTAVRLLFLSNVQFIRFHKHHEESQTNSLPQDSVAERGKGAASDTAAVAADADTISRGDSVGDGHPVLPLDSGAATHRMAPRRRMPGRR